ncbi:MAG: hypothetical protein RJQ01_09405 [Microcella sp.]|uniref:hypothetical protein n=1 Tax=Microcella sp. TaxID=1913979 RepID=UPI003315B8AA
MSTRTPSAAASALIEACAEAGEVVSARQIERWRQLDLLPRPARRGLGRGKGSASAYPVEATELATAIASRIRAGERLDFMGLLLFVERLPVPEAGIRRALTELIREMGGRLAADDGSEDHFARAEDTATRTRRDLVRRPHWRERRRRLRGLPETADSVFGSVITNLGRIVLGDQPPGEALGEIARAFGYSTTQRPPGGDGAQIDLRVFDEHLGSLTLDGLSRAARTIPLPRLVAARDCVLAFSGPPDEPADITALLCTAVREAGYLAPVQVSKDQIVIGISALTLAHLGQDLPASEPAVASLDAGATYIRALRRLRRSISDDELRVVLRGGHDAPPTAAETRERLAALLQQHFSEHRSDAQILLDDQRGG